MGCRYRVAIAAALAGIAVMAGAFGAHAMGDANPRGVKLLETGSHYQMIHAVAVLAIEALGTRPHAAADLLLAGAILFPASLYALALGAPTMVATLAPIGGTALIAGWIVLAVTTLRRR